jgi:hypothetical protein
MFRLDMHMSNGHLSCPLDPMDSHMSNGHFIYVHWTFALVLDMYGFEPEANNCFSFLRKSFVFLGLNIYFNFAYFFISNFHKTASRHFENFGFVYNHFFNHCFVVKYINSD